jgi:N-acetylneuraminate synthase/N,N'-diacetyllegionaminate synthase
MNIAGRAISRHTPPYVIAELGVNHDGDADRAVEMTHAAASAGADAVKLQLFTARGLMSRASKLAGYQAGAGEVDPVAMLARLELSPGAMARVVRAAHERGVHAIVTVFSVELVGLALELGFDAFKTASPDVVHRPLLEALSGTGKPLIVSTGAATMGEVARCVEWLACARDRVAMLQCVSSYPTPDAQAELGGIAALARTFGGPVGYSDHTTSERQSAISAVGLGACVLEKHLTHSRAAPGPDHPASLEPAQLAQYCRAALEAYAGRSTGRALAPELAAMMTGGTKSVLAIEHDVQRVSRQSIVLKGRLDAGGLVTPELVTFKRPGTGLAPWRLREVIGVRAVRDIEADMPVTEADLGLSTPGGEP